MIFFHRFRPESSAAPEAHKEYAARSSVLAALGLVTIKAAVGFSTGSLGILAEAAHSLLDLMAAGFTWYAVRVSSKPADEDHPYGHGKVENLSAMLETMLLLVTCFWIIHAATQRLITGKVDIEVTIWSYVVMGISIVVDVSRSRLLFAAARKYHSQALEADALHFSTDIWSSAVVILGLACVSLSEVFKDATFLRYADAIAAIIVALIVVQVSWRLGMRTVNALLDSCPAGLTERVIRIVEKIPGVVNCHQVRIRCSGPQTFVDLHVLMDGKMPLKDAHRLTELIEEAISEEIRGADITVHPEPL